MHLRKTSRWTVEDRNRGYRKRADWKRATEIEFGCRHFDFVVPKEYPNGIIRSSKCAHKTM